MRFFNYRFHQIHGISKANWNPYTMLDWKQQGLPFIEFGTRVDFGQHHPECPPDYNQVRLRVGNWRLTLHFSFVNCEFDAPVIYGVSIAQTLLPFWKIYKNSGLSVEDIRTSISELSSAGVPTKQILENIMRLTDKYQWIMNHWEARRTLLKERQKRNANQS